MNKFENIKCSYFSAKHYPTFKTKGLHRSDIKRTIQYYGEDGFQSMNELKNYYGLLPRIIRYDIESYGSFDVSYSSKYSINALRDPKRTLSLLIEMINVSINEVLRSKKIIDDSSYNIIPIAGEKIYIPTTNPWVLTFGDALDDAYLTDLIKELDDNNFTLFNTNLSHKNSFTLSSMVYDEDKNSIFSLHIDNERVIVIPYMKNISDTFMRLYETLTFFDPDAILEEFNDEQ